MSLCPCSKQVLMNRIRHESRQYGHGKDLWTRARRQAAKFILIISFSTLALKFSTHIAPRPGRGRTWDRRDPFKLCTTRPGPSKFKKEKLVILQRGQDGGGLRIAMHFAPRHCTIHASSSMYCCCCYRFETLMEPAALVVLLYDTIRWHGRHPQPSQ